VPARRRTPLSAKVDGVIWWISLGIVVLALVLLVLAFVPLARRAPAARRAVRRLQRRVEAVQGLQSGPLLALQERTVALAEQAAVTNERLQVIQARRGGED